MDRYLNTRTLLDSKKKRRYKETYFIPTLEKTADDIYVIATIEDRLDLFAQKYYNFYEHIISKQPKKTSKMNPKVNIIQYFIILFDDKY